MTYRVVFSKSAKRQIDKPSEDDRIRIRERIKELIVEPSKYGKPLTGAFGARNVWSSRVGNYRILYVIFEEKKEVLVIRVDLGRRVYRL